MPTEPWDEVGARFAALRDGLAALAERSSQVLGAARSIVASSRAAAQERARVREQWLTRDPSGADAQVALREPSAHREEIAELHAQLDGLQVALETRAVIEQAKGMVMLREGLDPDAAFRMLVAISQRSHRKLRDVAALVVGSAGERQTSTRTGGRQHL